MNPEYYSGQTSAEISRIARTAKPFRTKEYQLEGFEQPGQICAQVLTTPYLRRARNGDVLFA
jgi:hypothetical protein